VKLDAVRSAALALPDVTEAPHHHFGSFRVRGRIFVTVPPDRLHIHVFLDETDRERALAMHPGVVEKLLWGGKVVGVRIALADAVPEAVTVLLRQAHAFQATKPAVRSARKPTKPR
jgi:hypothetical protein